MKKLWRDTIYIEKCFAWIPTYINGTLIWFQHYWWQSSVPYNALNEYGYLYDPTKGAT